jgi:hypothetical protein
MALSYVCNVEQNRVESPLIRPIWNFTRTQNSAGRIRRRDNGQDYASDGHDDDGSTPGNPKPGRFVGSVLAQGVSGPNVRHGDNGLDYVEADRDDDGSDESGVLPSSMERDYAADEDEGDLKGGIRRTPADMLNAETDIGPQGSEQGPLTVMPWPTSLFRKRSAQQR